MLHQIVAPDNLHSQFPWFYKLNRYEEVKWNKWNLLFHSIPFSYIYLYSKIHAYNTSISQYKIFIPILFVGSNK